MCICIDACLVICILQRTEDCVKDSLKLRLCTAAQEQMFSTAVHCTTWPIAGARVFVTLLVTHQGGRSYCVPEHAATKGLWLSSQPIISMPFCCLH